MNNAEIIKKVFPLLRENETIVDIPKKCVGNFLCVLVAYAIIFVLALKLIMYFEVFSNFINFLNTYNFADFYFNDIWFFVKLIGPAIPLLLIFFSLIFLPITFCLEKIVVTTERLIIFSLLGVKIVEKKDIYSPIPFASYDSNFLDKKEILHQVPAFMLNCLTKQNLDKIRKNAGITYDMALNSLLIKNVLIKTVSSEDYTVAFYDYRTIRKILGFT